MRNLISFEQQIDLKYSNKFNNMKPKIMIINLEAKE